METGVVHTFCTEDGHLLKLRALRPEDAHHLVDLFNHMGPESRFLRFNLTLTDPDPAFVWEEARRMALVDPSRDGAWLAFADLPNQTDAPVGGVRFIRTEADVAEASLAVRDDMQGKGIGSELLRFLVQQARAAGIRQLTALAQRSNRPLWRMLRKATVPMEFRSEGSSTMIIADLTGSDQAPNGGPGAEDDR